MPSIRIFARALSGRRQVTVSHAELAAQVSRDTLACDLQPWHRPVHPGGMEGWLLTTHQSLDKMTLCTIVFIWKLAV